MTPIYDYLETNGLEAGFSNKWESIKFYNQNLKFHQKFIDIVNSTLGTLDRKKISIAEHQFRLDKMKFLKAPATLLQFYQKKLDKSKVGAGSQSFISGQVGISLRALYRGKSGKIN